jgi:hypothetical protein
VPSPPQTAQPTAWGHAGLRTRRPQDHWYPACTRICNPTCRLVPERVDGLEAEDHCADEGEAGQQLPPRPHQLRFMAYTVEKAPGMHATVPLSFLKVPPRRPFHASAPSTTLGSGPPLMCDDGATHLTDLLAPARGRRRRRRRRRRRPVPSRPGLGSPAPLAGLPSVGLSGKDLRLDQSAAAPPRIALPWVLLLRLRANCCAHTHRADPPTGPVQVALLLRRLLPAALRRRCCQGGGSSGTADRQLHDIQSAQSFCKGFSLAGPLCEHVEIAFGGPDSTSVRSQQWDMPHDLALVGKLASMYRDRRLTACRWNAMVFEAESKLRVLSRVQWKFGLNSRLEATAASSKHTAAHTLHVNRQNAARRPSVKCLQTSSSR